MSFDRQAQLLNQVSEELPALSPFIKNGPADMRVGSWNYKSLSFQRGFESLWNCAVKSPTCLLWSPLLLLWRQSIELAIKASIIEISGTIKDKPGHNLIKLFEQLRELIIESGQSANDQYTETVHQMIKYAQSIDPFADRFRYPTSKEGTVFDNMEVDIDEIFKAHALIVCWCESVAMK